MAKINNFIVEYAEVFKGLKFNFDDSKPPKYLIKRFVKIITAEVDDPRYEDMCTYPLEVILCVAFLAVLGDCKSWGEIADFGNDYKRWLAKFLPLGETMPIDDTYRRVFSLISPNELSKATIKYITELFVKIKATLKKHLRNGSNYKLISIDGKEGRATGRLYNSPDKVANLRTLNVYDASDGISLFSIPISEKSNEIPEAQNILKTMNLKNVIVSMDSLHAQHKTFDIIIENKGDYCIGLKGNQKDAFEEINLTVTEKLLNSIREKHFQTRYRLTKNNKEYFQIPFHIFAIDKGGKTPKFSGARNIICYRKINKKTGEVVTLYFITSLNDIDLSIDAITGRWDVENLLHRYLDMDFGEDDNKTMDVKAYTNLSIINKLCLSILKIAKPILENRSMRRIKKSVGRSLSSYLSIILSAIDPVEIEKILTQKNSEIKK